MPRVKCFTIQVPCPNTTSLILHWTTLQRFTTVTSYAQLKPSAIYAVYYAYLCEDLLKNRNMINTTKDKSRFYTSVNEFTSQTSKLHLKAVRCPISYFLRYEINL
jgi:hypothetical protein